MRYGIVLAIVGVLLAVGCGPTTKNMSVVYFTSTWDMGEVKDCGAHPISHPEAFSGKLICSDLEYGGLGLTVNGEPNSQEPVALRSRLNNPKIFAVAFSGSGNPHYVFAAGSTGWKCRRTTEGLSCE